MALPDLITLVYATAQLAAGGKVLSTAQTAALPSKITEASTSVRRWCGDRDFTRGTYDEESSPALDGTVLPRQFPVNGVKRVSGGRTAGLTITQADTATNVRASVGFTSSGDEATGLTFTGIALVRTAAGSEIEADLSFTSYPTLAGLAAAVNAVGSGWSATVPANLAGWPSAELVGGDAAQDAMNTGAELEIYAEVLSGCKLDRRTGLLSVGLAGGINQFDGYRWGPYQDPSTNDCLGMVRVVYDAGFDTIPSPVQQATALVVGKLLDDLSRDLALGSESAGAGGYVVNTAFQEADIPKEARALLALYRSPRV